MPLLLFCRCHRKKKSRSNSSLLLPPPPPPPPPPTPPSPSPPPNDDPIALVCHTCKLSIGRSELHINIQQQHPPRQYHIGCFVCLHCHAPINPQSEDFCYSKLNYRKGATTRRRGARHSRGREQVNKGTNTDNEADINSANTTPLSRLDIINTKDDEKHAFHRACFAHHFGWLCVVCEKPLPITVTTKPVDSSNDTTPSPTSTYGATRAGRTDTTSIPSSNQNAFHNSNNSAQDVTVSNQNLKWRRTAKVEFLKHPFWSNERMCPHHFETVVATDTVMLQQQPQQHCMVLDHFYHSTGGEGDDNLTILRSSSADTSAAADVGETKTIRRCTSCHRFEPLASPAKHFINFGDLKSGHCLCLACCRTVATSTDDVIPHWDRVIDFFEGPLGLITPEDSCTTINATGRRIKTGVSRQDLKTIPIVMVGMDALNDNMRELRNDHFGIEQIMTRGLCLSEYHGTATKQDVAASVEVSAIFCLSGLPSDLTASILAHEATHAYIKLHPNFSHTNPLPLKVEEGLAQLVAHLFLSDGLDGQLSTSSTTAKTACSTTSTTTTPDGFDDSNVAIDAENDTNDIDDGGGIGDDSIPSDDQLREYFRFCIETDDGVYGEGFRLAAQAYAKMGLQELLYYVALHQCFPPS